MLIDIERLVIKDRIRKDYGNIEELANDIKENGLINPPVATEKNGEIILIAGERRTRACKYLGYKQIEIRLMSVKDALHQLKLEISENENRKDFSFSEKMAWAEELKKEYEKVAKDNQGKRNDLCETFHTSKNIGRVTDKIAKDLDMGSGKNFEKAEFIHKNADEELIQKLDEGQLTINKAYNTLKEQLKKQEEENNKLKTELEKEKNKPKQKEYIETVIDNTDYTVVNKLKKIEKELEEKRTESDRLQRKLDIAVERAKIFEENSEEYKKLKRQIEVLSKEKDDISKAITSGTELSGLIHSIEGVLKNDLCPIKYSRAILDMSENKTVIKNLQEIIEVVELWCFDMRKYLPKNKQNIIIDVEEN